MSGVLDTLWAAVSPDRSRIEIIMLILKLAEENYVRPNEYIPERWFSQPELIKSKNAFFPFSLGMPPSARLISL